MMSSSVAQAVDPSSSPCNAWGKWQALGERVWSCRSLMLALSLTLVTALGLSGYRQFKNYKRFVAHDPGRVYRSPWLGEEAYSKLIPEYGIRTVINLCASGEKNDRIEQQRQAVEAAGAKLVELAFPSNHTWHTDDPSFRVAEKLLDDPQSYPIWVHCWQGRERTVKLLSMYDIRQRGMTARDSLDAMPLFGVPHPWPMVVFAHKYEDDQRAAPTHQIARPPSHTPHR